MKFKSIISLLSILLISQCESSIIKPLDFSEFDFKLFDALKEPVTHRPLILEDDDDDNKKEIEYEINTLRSIFDIDDEFKGQSTTKSSEKDVDKATESSTMLKSDNILKDINDLVDENKLNPSIILVDDENQPTSTVPHLPVPLLLSSPTPFVAPVDDEIETSPKVTPVDNKIEPKLPVTSVDDKKTITPSIVPVDDRKEPQPSVTSTDDASNFKSSVTSVDNKKKPTPSIVLVDDNKEMLSKVTPVDDESESKLPVTSVDDKKKITPSIVPVDDDKATSFKVTPVDDTKEPQPSVTTTDNETKPILSTTPDDDKNKSKSPVLSKNNVIESPTIPKNDDVTTQSPDASNNNKEYRSHRVAVLTNENEVKYIKPLSDKFNIQLVDIFKSDSKKPKNNDENKPKTRPTEPKPTSLDNRDTKPPVTVDNKDRKPDSEIPPYAKYNVDLLDHNKQGPFQPIPSVISAFPPIPLTFSRIPAIPQIPDIFIPQIPPVYIPRHPAFQIPQFPPHFPFARNIPVLNRRTGLFNHYPTQQIPFFNHYPTQQVPTFNNHPYTERKMWKLFL